MKAEAAKMVKYVKVEKSKQINKIFLSLFNGVALGTNTFISTFLIIFF